MHKRFAVLAGLLFLAAPSLVAKGRTLKISIATTDQTRPIEVDDPAVGQFHIWEGPGVRINNVPQTEGFIADWSKGTVEQRPAGLPRYRVSFYTGCLKEEVGCNKPGERKLSYVVLYEYDAAATQGYVYLPGKADEWHEVNAQSIRRGLEGNWFQATSAWREYIASVIAKAQL